MRYEKGLSWEKVKRSMIKYGTFTSNSMNYVNSSICNNGTDSDPKDEMEDTDVVAENSRIRNTNLTQLFKEENLVLR
jgi:hypothetical protein